MEKFGFVKCVRFLESEGLHLKTLITDRHLEISSYVNKYMPDTEHLYDVWHVAKSKREILNV